MISLSLFLSSGSGFPTCSRQFKPRLSHNRVTRNELSSGGYFANLKKPEFFTSSGQCGVIGVQFVEVRLKFVSVNITLVFAQKERNNAFVKVVSRHENMTERQII
jgi:hypothetical protein